MKGLFDRIGCTSFLQKFSGWHYCPYALFWGIARQNRVSVRGNIKGIKVVIYPATITDAFGCLKEGLVFENDWKNNISQETVDLMLYDKP